MTIARGRHRSDSRPTTGDRTWPLWSYPRPVKAAVRERYGPAEEVVELREVEHPTPGDGEIVIRMHAASINRADFDGIQPRPKFVRLFLGLRAPRNHRLGLDVAGVVESVGTGVTRFAPGDRVFADLYPFSQGAFAEYACAPERAFAPIPDTMTFEDASTLPHSADPRDPGPSAAKRPSPGSRRQGPHRRRVRQRRPVRGPDGEGDGRRGDRRLQPGQDGLRPVARRRPRHRLHDDRLHADRRALRLDRRHRFAPSDPADPAGVATRRRLRDARRRGRARSPRR